MIKKIIKKLIHSLGFDLVKYDSGKSKNYKSVKTNNLSFYRTATGNYFLPTDAKNDVVANTIISNQIFEKDVVDLATKYIKPETSVLDIGSNFGQMSILFSNLIGKNGRVHAFDADDWIYEILVKNIVANNKENIIIPHLGAIHNIDGMDLIFPIQDFEKFDSYGSYGIDYTAVTGRIVKSVTIDSFDIQELISFMKVDIQGGDLQAMQGAVKTIERNKMPILFEYEYQLEDKFNLSFQEYIDFVLSINYHFAKVVNGHNYLILPNN